MSLFSKKKKKASNFKNVTKMATTILLHSQKVTACVCLECTRLQRQTFFFFFVGVAVRSDGLPRRPQIVAALPSSKVSKEGHTVLNPFLTALRCLIHEKKSFTSFFSPKNSPRIICYESIPTQSSGVFQPAWVSE